MTTDRVLNEQQARAVRARGHTLVVSVPGSGKTSTLVAKAANILRKDATATLVLVTFTRDAAEEMSTRLAADLGRVPKNVLIGTFHSLSIALLKSRGRKVKVLNPDKQTGLMWRAYSRICGAAGRGDWIPWEEAVREVERLKTKLNPVIKDSTAAGRIYLSYQTLLADDQGMDFADLLLESVRGMRDGTIKPFGCRYLFVDEAQDTDEVQMAWIESHIAVGAEVTMVGDDDQSIYSWRNALGYAGMMEFERRYRAQRITLAINYRSDVRIIEAANNLIHNNSERLPKVIQANTQNQGVARHVQCRTRAQESEAVVDAISGDPHEWVVLARANHQLDSLSAALKRYNVPYHQPGAQQFWGRQHIAKPLTTLWSLALDGTGHHDESAGVEQLLAAAGVDEDTIQQRRPFKFDHLKEFEQLVVRDDRKDFRNMLELVESWRQKATSTAGPDISSVFLQVYDWYDENAPLHAGPNGLQRAAANGLLKKQRKIASSVLSKMHGTFRDRIEKIREPRTFEALHVSLLTIHATKGREFDRVWVVGAEQGGLPFQDSELEEERRLYYVAITRARKELVISSVYKDSNENRENAAEPSQFIDEAGLLNHRLSATA
jgi:superfamily I DNA/RNA helicase